MVKNTLKEVKHYKTKSLPSVPVPDAILYVKGDGDTDITTYITDLNGIPFLLKDNQGNTGIQTITNTDGTISVLGTDNTVLNLSTSIKNIINSALQSGDNISNLINDAGYITSAELIPYELLSNKQNSLNIDGTGSKYPTVDAINAENEIIYDILDQKLNIVDYNQYFQGKFISLSALEAAIPVGKDGDYAIVDTGAGTDAKIYLWDSEEGWVEGSNSSPSSTDALPEGTTNLYFQTARVLATIINGVSFVIGTPITSADNILGAFGKLQKQINDLFTALSNIFQPDQLISSVPPTRIVNTFTYPATQYVALISGTIRNNPAPFVTTIDVASTVDHKRIDLIYFKSDNTLVKVVGVESLTVAPRPDIPVGIVGVPVSFINVFGNTVSDPTPIINEISIQNSSGVEIFKVPENGFMRFKGVSFNILAKQIEVDPLVGGVIFVSSTGNNLTAEVENRNKPYQTLDAAITAYWSNSSIDYIEIISDTSFTASVALDNGTSNRKFDLRSQKTCIVSITRSGILGRSAQNFNFYLPNGTLRFAATANQSLGGGGIGIGNVNIETNTTEYNSFYNTSRLAKYDIKSSILNLNGTASGICANNGGASPVTITVKTINCRGANTSIIGAFCDTLLDFDLLTHDNSFSLTNVTSGALKINHGNISSVAPYTNATNVLYLRITALGTTANYKTGSTISSNLSINVGAATGTLTLSGNVSYINSNNILSNINVDDKVFITNATITCKKLVGVGSFKRFTITNSYFNITGTVFIDTQNGSLSDVFTTDTVTFKGSNFVIFDIAGSNLYNVSGLAAMNRPSAKIVDGILNTNGKFDRSKIDIIESPLNQYYDTVQRQLVLVDEKEEIINKVLDSTKTYVINGVITLLTGEYIQVPSGGLTIQGYGYDTSGIVKNVSGQSIFISPIGNSGNLTLSSCYFNSGLGTVFNITDSAGTHAIEINDVNFNSCSSLGTLNSYRQFTGTTCGFYNVSDGLTFEGNWSGLKLTNSNVINFGSTGILFKKGTATLFSNRFYIDLNLQISTGSKICDFTPTNFTNDKSLQVVNCYVKVNGIIDDTTTNITFPNITPYSAKSYFVNNIGIKNSNNMPYGITTINMQTYADDTAAASGGIVQIGETYIESSTGYFKKRLT